MPNKILKNSLLLVFSFLFFNLSSAHAEDFQCEVMSLEGSAFVTNAEASHKSLKEGDLLKASDLIEPDADSYVDIAYDKDWKNVVRVEENSKIEIKTIYPTTVKMTSGGVFARLKALPKQSTFQVETPTAIAAVRGTEYRTTHQEGGTEVYNFSDSQVFVFSQDESGKVGETPTIVENSQATQVLRPGALPMPPRKMSTNEFLKGGQFREGLERKINENINQGRVGKVQDMRQIEKIHQERMNAAQGRGGLVSHERGQEQPGKMKELMNREDKMLRTMDRAKETHQGKMEPSGEKRRDAANQNQEQLRQNGPNQGKPLAPGGRRKENPQDSKGEAKDQGDRPNSTGPRPNPPR